MNRYIYEAYDTSTSQWLISYLTVVKHVEEFGELPSRTQGEYKESGRWIATQRSNYKKGRLEQKQINALEAIGILPLCGPRDEFNRMYKATYEYVAENHRLPTAKKGGDGFALTSWYHSQTRKLKKTCINRLEEYPEKEQKEILDRVEKLDKIEKNIQSAFSIHLDKVEAFIRDNHRFPMSGPGGSKAEKSMATWIRNQEKKGLNGKLSTEDYNRLKAVLHEIDADRAETDIIYRLPRYTFEERLQQLTDYMTEHNERPRFTKDNAGTEVGRLANWVSSITFRIKNEKISQEKAQAFLSVYNKIM